VDTAKIKHVAKKRDAGKLSNSPSPGNSGNEEKSVRSEAHLIHVLHLSAVSCYPGTIDRTCSDLP
jgi:hypothetical protein